ncbi:unnamed protein product [Spirodela intermedia]|uniref:Uncharacterized protein n=1 Tax=Spirodela intermedia TaxID=51605 RepID=A0A7I8L980_SPIIN|nr:unnamed protein product [Spirodela intermedia]
MCPLITRVRLFHHFRLDLSGWVVLDPVKEPPICELLDGGLIATQRREMVMAMSPDQTKTMVGVLPRRPIRPLAKG